MSNATMGYGSILAVCDADESGAESGAYAAIAQTVDLPMPEPEVGDVKITNNDSPNRAHEYMAGGGLVEPGEFEFEVIYKTDVCATLYAMFGDGLNYWWRETFPDGSFWKFPGYLKSLGGEAPTEDGAIRSTWTVKATTKPAYTEGS